KIEPKWGQTPVSRNRGLTPLFAVYGLRRGVMDVTAWVMMAHIVTLGTWGAAWLILAGLYATSPMAEERAATLRHELMCRYVFVMLGSPAAVLAIINGSALLALRGVEGSWLLAKLAVVAVLAQYHSNCRHLLHQQENGPL